ncbi:UNVERIFIED_CONTAM: Aberrant root formation protein 4 [Sesamum latifolium]|uniref:Aberrant root formation protein 4 n=1 Tax=Sesamum latifolium TaxID=2727402 RepID=A0AAW2VGM5_9LAMI
MVAASDALGAALHQTLASCSEQVRGSIAEIVNFLNSISDSVVAGERENEDPEKIAVEILTQIHQYMASPAVKQEVIDALAFELPKAVARFACVSTKCLEIAEDLVYWFIERCSPRDMLSILCEAIGSPSELFTVPGYFIPLLGGLMKVLVLIQRRHYQQVKSAVPVILNVLKTMCSTSDDEDTDHEKLFHKATGIACSIRSICVNLDGEDKKKLRALLGLYVLQIMALASFGITSDILKCLSVVVELSDFLQHCELSYVGLITGYEVDTIYKLVVEDDSKDDMDCFSQAKLGAALAVIWGFKASEVATAAKADLPVVIMELQGNWARRCEAIGMLKYIFLCANLPWELKQQGIRFLLRVMDGIVSHSYDDPVDYSMYMPTWYTSLQAVEMVIMYAPDSALRKDAFSAFKKVTSSFSRIPRLNKQVIVIVVNGALWRARLSPFVACGAGLRPGVAMVRAFVSPGLFRITPVGILTLSLPLLLIPCTTAAAVAYSLGRHQVLADIPTSVRFDVLRALIKNSDSSSMIGILLDCVKEEMRMGKIERNSSADAVLNSKVSQSTDFWNPSVLELVEVVLRPPKGGPPSLPQSSDAVLSALNLYRFILITESSGNSNSTGILSKDKLQKAYNEWLLPLRTLVTGIMAESQNDYENLACDTICALNPVELVLYRCIELVEEKLNGGVL